MKKNEIISALEPVIKVFDELGLLYYIGGSIASSAYGIARATMDVDLILNLDASYIESLLEKLKDNYFIDGEMISDAVKAKSSFNIIHLETMLKIDIFILKDHPYAQKAFERKIKDKLEEEPSAISIYLCSPEDIILCKLDWYKAGSETSERQWMDIIGVIKVQRDNLDKSYLNIWAQKLGLLNLLKKAFQESKLKL